MEPNNLDWKALMREMMIKPLPSNYTVTYQPFDMEIPKPRKMNKSEISEFLEELEKIQAAGIETALEHSDYKEAKAVLAKIMSM
jgi:hypothetical protein